MSINPMKIVIITPNYAPEQGACAERVRHLAEFLHKKGHTILVITALPNYPTGKIFSTYAKTFHATEVINEITVLRYWLLPSHSKNLFFRLLAMLSLALTTLFSLPKIIKFKPTLVYVQSPPLFLALSGYIIAKLCKAKFWLNLSDLWSSVLLDLGIISTSFIYKSIQQLEFFLYKKAYLLSGQSQEIVNFIQPIVVHSRVFLCRTGVDTELFKPIYTKEPTKKIRFVYAGLLGIAQGVLDFCKQVSFPDEVELHIYGDGAERMALTKYLSNNPTKPIFLHAPLPQPILATILPTFDVALLMQRTTIYGTVPSKLYEAMACGLLIVYVGGGEGQKLMQEFNLYHTLFQNSQPVESIKEIISLLYLNPTHSQLYRKKAREVAVNQFDRGKILEEFYKKMMEYVL